MLTVFHLGIRIKGDVLACIKILHIDVDISTRSMDVVSAETSTWIEIALSFPGQFYVAVTLTVVLAVVHRDWHLLNLSYSNTWPLLDLLAVIVILLKILMARLTMWELFLLIG